MSRYSCLRLGVHVRSSITNIEELQVHECLLDIDLIKLLTASFYLSAYLFLIEQNGANQLGVWRICPILLYDEVGDVDCLLTLIEQPPLVS